MCMLFAQDAAQPGTGLFHEYTYIAFWKYTLIPSRLSRAFIWHTPSGFVKMRKISPLSIYILFLALYSV